MRLIGIFCISLLTALLNAAELPDPTTSGHSQHVIATLAALRAPLDAKPHDPALLAAAQMAYVELCFTGDTNLDGAFGPWAERARDMSRRRQVLRGETPPADLTEAAPDLWLALIEGRNRHVIEQLQRWPEAAASPAARALRSAAAYDTQIFSDQAPRTALESYGYLIACSETKVEGSFLRNPELQRLSDPFARQVALGTFMWIDYVQAIRSVIVDVAWMYNSAEIPDPIANEHLQALAAACGDHELLSGTRGERMQKAMRAAQQCDTASPQPLVAAWKACRAVSGPGALMTADGHHRLIGVPEVATWNLDRLYLAMIKQMTNLEDAERAPLSAVYRDELPGTLLAARASYPANTYRATREQAEALAAAARRCLAGEEGSSSALACWALERIAQVQRADAAELLIQALKQRNPASGPHSNAFLMTLWGAAQSADRVGLIAARIRTSAEDNPYCEPLYQAARLIDLKRPLVPIGERDAILQRTESAVDIRSMPIPGTALSIYLAGRWTGFMRVDAGDTKIAVESDDGSRLVVGDAVVLNLGQHAMKQRSTAITQAAAGWLPLQMEWFNSQGGGGIRLLWQAPGGTTWTAVPAERLAHGPDRQPGLQAEYWQCDEHLIELIEGPQAQDLQRVADMPWHYPAAAEVGMALTQAKRFPEALPWLRLAAKNSKTTAENQRALVQALAGIATPEIAEELAGAFRTQACLKKDIRAADALGTQMAIAGCELPIKSLFARHDYGCCVEGIPLGYMALCRAEWRPALKFFAEMEAHRRIDHPSDRWLREFLALQKTILERVTASQEPDWNAWREFALDNKTTGYLRLFAKWYTGEVTWEEATQRRATTPDGDRILWLHALHCSTTGDHQQATLDLQEMAKTHPTWREGALSQGLLRWYSRQTPASLAALPTAAPLPAQRGAPTPEEKLNF